MAVDLADLVESLQREVSPPGSDLYPAATEDTWVGYLADAFWEARLNGLLSGYAEADGLIEPLNASADDMSRDLQQLLVLYAGLRITLTAFQNVNGSFRAKAGPVEFETSKSATVLAGVLDAIRERIRRALDLVEQNSATGVDVVMFDAVIERSCAIQSGAGWFVK